MVHTAPDCTRFAIDLDWDAHGESYHGRNSLAHNRAAILPSISSCLIGRSPGDATRLIISFGQILHYPKNGYVLEYNMTNRRHC